MGNIIDGKGISVEIKKHLKQRIDLLKAEEKVIPGLATIMVGSDEASKAYVASKERVCSEAGIYTENYILSPDIGIRELIDLIQRLNNDSRINGILVQLPLPDSIDEKRIGAAICPEKDVDGINPINMGRLLAGQRCLMPCTPKGIIRLLKSIDIDICGRHAVIIGRSNIVGKPCAAMLLNENATVTICHSRTKSLRDYTRKADILVSAVGKPGLIRGDMVKEGAVVIDAGTTMVGNRLTGDVIFDEVSRISSWITPVPGGVGAMTIAMLIENTIEAVMG